MPLTLTQKFDPAGKEIVTERRYSYTVEADANIAQMLNAAQGGGREHAASGPVQAGDTIILTYTEAEMAQLLGFTISEGADGNIANDGAVALPGKLTIAGRSG